MTENDQADEKAIVCLCTWLTSFATAFIQNHGTIPERDNFLDYEDFFEHFFRYGLYMYTTDQIGDECIDDLIQLARCYERDPEVFAIVAQDCLPDDMVDELQSWIRYPDEHPQAPKALEDHVTAAVAALLGAMQEPTIA